MICDAIHTEENNALCTMIDTLSDMDDSCLCSLNKSQSEGNSDKDMSLSLSSSSSSLSSSSSYSYSSSSSTFSLSSDLSDSDGRLQILLQTMQQQHHCITTSIHDPSIEWGKQ